MTDDNCYSTVVNSNCTILSAETPFVVLLVEPRGRWRFTASLGSQFNRQSLVFWAQQLGINPITTSPQSSLDTCRINHYSTSSARHEEGQGTLEWE
jgi:hypothetical protein